MNIQKKQPCRKNEYQKISFDLKLSIIDEINNGQIFHLIMLPRSMEFHEVPLTTGARNCLTLSLNPKPF
jgi:hypothetical protein